jgi:hypothetical protein
VALKLMSMPPTAAGGERNWSTCSFIWSNSCNRLLLGRVALLVYIYFNSRVLTKTSRSFSTTDWPSFLEELDTMAELDLDGMRELDLNRD